MHWQDKTDNPYPLSAAALQFRLIVAVVLVTLITAAVALSLHYYFSRAMVLDSAMARYQQTVSATRDYLRNLDNNALQTTRALAQYPQLVEGQWVNRATPQLFAEVMRNNPVLYAIYIGFENGDVYELVNLNSSDAVRRQLKAAPSDRWVVITVTGKGDQRRRRFEFYDLHMQQTFARDEASDYNASQRLWYTSAQSGSVNKTQPYLFQHLQAPGQSYSTRIAGGQAVLAVDIAFSTLAAHLRSQPLSLDGEIYLYQQSGEIIASNAERWNEDRLPPADLFTLSEAQTRYIDSLGLLRISNETDWPPIDFAVSAEPRGYSIDLLRLIAQMTGLNIEFVNGYAWPELMELFRRKELEILQPVLSRQQLPGVMTQSFLQLPYAVVQRPENAEINDLQQLNGKILAIPAGWSVINVIRNNYPQITLLDIANTREALEAVKQGRADAALDMELILRKTADQYFINGLRFSQQIGGLELLPQGLKLLLQEDLHPLAAILDQVLAAIRPQTWQFLQDKWLAGEDASRSAVPAVVPYPQLLSMTRHNALQNRLEKTTINGAEYYIFASSFEHKQSTREHFAFVISAQRLFAGSSREVWWSVLIIAAVWLLLIPPVLLLLVLRPLRHFGSDNHG
jgi:ABC-type amino acid transport substrate-binding protein